MGRTTSDIGVGVQAVIIPLYIIDIGGSAATVGLSAFLFMLPAIVIYPFAGVIGDRFNRKHIMISANLSSAAVDKLAVLPLIVFDSTCICLAGAGPVGIQEKEYWSGIVRKDEWILCPICESKTRVNTRRHGA